jgi:hypothetical protein
MSVLIFRLISLLNTAKQHLLFVDKCIEVTASTFGGTSSLKEIILQKRILFENLVVAQLVYNLPTTFKDIRSHYHSHKSHLLGSGLTKSFPLLMGFGKEDKL